MYLASFARCVPLTNQKAIPLKRLLLRSAVCNYARMRFRIFHSHMHERTFGEALHMKMKENETK